MLPKIICSSTSDSFQLLLGFVVLLFINLFGLSNSKAIFVEEQQWYYLTHNLVGDKRVPPFLTGINLKLNILAQLEFELAFFEAL